VEFRVLGPLEVEGEAGQVGLGGARQRALLALLLTRANEVVSSDRLIEGLWPSATPRTAANTLQFYVSQLRKVLGADRILTRSPGYLIRVHPGELDLDRFEHLVEDGSADSLREALALWRGPALADVAYESFAQAEIHRLEELRLLATERRIEADLATGRDAELVGELEELVREHPLREQLRALLMRALYRSGRQAEALAVYAAARGMLVDELGLEPGPVLRDLEQAILRHDPSLETPRDSVPVAPSRALLVSVQANEALDTLLSVAEPLARTPAREVILTQLVGAAEWLPAASALVHKHCSALQARGIAARAAAFTTSESGKDVVRLAAEQRVDLVLVDAPRSVVADGAFTPDVEVLLADAPCDVALVIGDRPALLDASTPVLVPFGGAEHDWAAVELAAWFAKSVGSALRLLGSEGGDGRRDASRLLANASLLVQRVIGISTDPLLVPRGPEAVVTASADAGLIVLGLSPRWRADGLGDARLVVAREATPATLLVRAGLRPGGLAPADTLTRFSWTLGPGR
jgi:DNA-binding SARP family transcriptional activator